MQKIDKNSAAFLHKLTNENLTGILYIGRIKYSLSLL
jgi:hypothetical protein